MSLIPVGSYVQAGFGSTIYIGQITTRSERNAWLLGVCFKFLYYTDTKTCATLGAGWSGVVSLYYSHELTVLPDEVYKKLELQFELTS